ncbi:MAG: BadF/BadG/BcrA/BcrD ATPase family protein, partial [Thermoanaerobaculia bacterium]
MSLYIGVDGGGSKTSSIVVDESMHPLGRGEAGPSNFLRVGLDSARIELEKAILQAVRAADADFEQVAFTYCGIAGADHPEHRKRLVGALGSFFPRGNFTVASDARIALTAGIGLGEGIVIISGTGSVAFGRNDRGDEARAGGWGPTIGDEGSGYSIAREGLSAVVRAFDGRGPQTIITDLVCAHHDLCEPRDLPLFVYAPTTRAYDIAAYTRLIIEAANKGDDVAVQILREAGDELGQAVVAVAGQLEMKSHTCAVAYVGGAFHAGAFLIDPMERTIREACPNMWLA